MNRRQSTLSQCTFKLDNNLSRMTLPCVIIWPQPSSSDVFGFSGCWKWWPWTDDALSEEETPLLVLWISCCHRCCCLASGFLTSNGLRMLFGNFTRKYLNSVAVQRLIHRIIRRMDRCKIFSELRTGNIFFQSEYFVYDLPNRYSGGFVVCICA